MNPEPGSTGKIPTRKLGFTWFLRERDAKDLFTQTPLSGKVGLPLLRLTFWSFVCLHSKRWILLKVGFTYLYSKR